MKAMSSANKEKKNWLGDWRFMLTLAIAMPVSAFFFRGIDDPRNKNTPFLIGTFVPSCLIALIVYQFNKPKLEAEAFPAEKDGQLPDYKPPKENEVADPWEERDRGRL